MMGDYGDELPVGMTTRDIEIIADLVADRVMEKIEERGLPRDKHIAQHDWLASKMTAEQKAEGSRQRIIEKVVGAAGAVGLVALIVWLGNAILQTIAQAAGRIWP